MIDLFNIDENMCNLIESMLQHNSINPTHPNYIVPPNQPQPPNPVKKYDIVKFRRLYECEGVNECIMYIMPDDMKDTVVDNCTFLREYYVYVGVARKRDTLVTDFNFIRGVIGAIFGEGSGMNIIYNQLTDGVDTIMPARLGSFRIKDVRIQSTKRQQDKCGMYLFEALVRFRIPFNKFL